MSEHKKKRYENQVENQEEQGNLVLDIIPPHFMARIEKQEELLVTSAADDRKTTKPPRKQKLPRKRRQLQKEYSKEECQLELEKTAKKSTARKSSSTVEKPDVKPVTDPQRSPKTSRTAGSYQEAYVPDSEDFIYCEQCEQEWESECEKHPVNIVLDNSVSEKESNANRAVKTTPSILSIGLSRIPNVGEGVWSKEAIPYRTRFGPYEGKVVTPKDELGYGWLIRKNNKQSDGVDASDPSASNWMRYVNGTTQVDEHNLIAYQHKGKIYYRSICEIAPQEELLVHYGDYRAGDTKKIFSKKKPPSKEKLYSCTTCTLQFVSPAYFKRHKCIGKRRTEAQREADNEEIPFKRFLCDLCSAKFLSRFHLERHVRTHTGEKPFVCPTCDARFAQKGNLDNHQRIHSNERPFVCGRCDARFALSSKLTRHILTHTGEKPFSCDKCDARFAQSNDLTRHMRVHTGEKPFACTHCPARYSDSTSLKRHIKSYCKKMEAEKLKKIEAEKSANCGS